MLMGKEIACTKTHIFDNIQKRMVQTQQLYINFISHFSNLSFLRLDFKAVFVYLKYVCKRGQASLIWNIYTPSAHFKSFKLQP